MTREEAKKIIENEELKRINWYDENNLQENETGIKFESGLWKIFATDERASIVDTSVIECESEEEALNILIKKARNSKIIFG